MYSILVNWFKVIIYDNIWMKDRMPNYPKQEDIIYMPERPIYEKR